MAMCTHQQDVREEMAARLAAAVKSMTEENASLRQQHARAIQVKSHSQPLIVQSLEQDTQARLAVMASECREKLSSAELLTQQLEQNNHELMKVPMQIHSIVTAISPHTHARKLYSLPQHERALSLSFHWHTLTHRPPFRFLPSTNLTVSLLF
jgi:hypothetical protein